MNNLNTKQFDGIKNEHYKFLMASNSHALSRMALHTQTAKTPICKTTILLRSSVNCNSPRSGAIHYSITSNGQSRGNTTMRGKYLMKTGRFIGQPSYRLDKFSMVSSRRLIASKLIKFSSTAA